MKNLLTLVLLLWSSNLYGAGVLLKWTASTSPDVQYRVYYGTQSHVYSDKVVAGNVTEYPIENLAPGTYYFAVTSFNGDGLESVFSNEVVKLILDVPTNYLAAFNFQPADFATPSGYTADSGALFNGIYGWNVKLDSRARTANPDPRLNTFVFSAAVSSAVARWEYVVPNGDYLVSLSCGDAEWAQGPHRVDVEGVRLVDDQTTVRGQFVTIADALVHVLDGKLTLTMGGTGGSTMLNYLVIKADLRNKVIPKAPEELLVK